MSCRVKGCEHVGDMAVCVNVPAMGVAIELHQPIKMIVSLAFCAQHAAEAAIGDFVTEEIRAAIRADLARMRKAPADFSRAWLSAIRRDSSEFLTFQAAFRPRH